MIVKNIWPGIYVQIILGPSEDKNMRALQFLGLATSLASTIKGTADWWVRSKSKYLKDCMCMLPDIAKNLDCVLPHFAPPLPNKNPTCVETLKSALFFTPHVIFRVVALSMCAGFLGYYAICPTALIICIVLCNFFCLYKKVEATEEKEGGHPMEMRERRQHGDSKKTLLITLLLTTLAPISFNSKSTADPTLMKRTITTSTAVLLTTLTILRLLPIIVSPDNLVATPGLRHLNFLPPTSGALALIFP